MNATRVDDGFTSSVQVYEPHRAGLPRLRPYISELWNRRHFAAELSRTTMRAANTRTFFGQLWLVLNPLLLAGVYYVLVSILAGRSGGAEMFVYLCAGLFVYYYFSGCMTTGASSVTSGGRLLLNQSFPRMLLPLSAVRTAFFRFLPTLIVYFPIHILMGLPLHWESVFGIYFLVMVTAFGAGTAMIVATLQVYFRDTTAFLPYFVRIWLYLSPVLWFPEQAPESFADFMILNPLYSLIGGWTDLLVRGTIPDLDMWVASALWGIGALIVGGLFFMSRERDFVVRL